ncbi:ABC transporter ATP-binding protein [Roseiterribacter gracilis]|uniref:ABC transporter ATP-binding protein n=1 Tax=Roseiterribacter gracilis TaxID=2812848 RepID=A0A8S8XB44_9PROT|nr:ABC transporter ATP-binding protein [Rhodospirillales bacterium TMPK1]
MTEILAAHDVAVEFTHDGQTLQAVRGIDLTLDEGETLALVGESGSGKSTLALALLGVHQLARGKVTFRGDELASVEPHIFRKHVQPVLQDPYASLDPRWRVARSIAEPLHALKFGNIEARVASLLDAVGLAAEFASYLPNALSGGQRQRVALARALAPEPSVLIADEPLSALDMSVQAQILTLLADLQRTSRIALLLIAHDLTLVQRVAQRVAVLYLGRVVEQGPAARTLAAPLHPYTAALIAATPSLARTAADAERLVLPGEPPSPLAPPPGCEFHPRCPIARDICRTERPLLVEHAPGRKAACHFAGEITRSSDISS